MSEDEKAIEKLTPEGCRRLQGLLSDSIQALMVLNRSAPLDSEMKRDLGCALFLVETAMCRLENEMDRED